jgi:thiol-disulfide isomerase/thioredoxin
MKREGISGKTVVIVFFVVVGVVGAGLWIALQDAKRRYVDAQTNAAASIASHQDATGWFRVTLETGEGGLPFYLRLPADPGEPAVIRNGEEDIEATWTASESGGVLDFPHYDATVELSFLPDGSLSGAYTKVREYGLLTPMPAIAERVDSPDPASLFPPFFGSDAEGPADFGGEWALGSVDGEQPALAVFEQTAGGVITGTIMTPTGDYRYLAGNVEGNQLRLSVFDGSHAFLFTASMNESGDGFEGIFNSGGYFRDAFNGRRDPSFVLPDSFSIADLREGETRPGIRRLQDSPYAGAPVIVFAFGTWCPNCNDAAPAINELLKKYSDTDVQVLGLAYERSDDTVRSERQIQRFKDRHGLDWEILPAGDNDRTQIAPRSLPALEAFVGFPTTMFINRDGTVRAINTGFQGPATGDAHTELLEDFDRLIGEIIDSPAP